MAPLKSLSALAVALAAFACNTATNSAETASGTANIADTTEGTTRKLEIPPVPPTIVGEQAMAAYTIQHFWDNMDFTDTVAVADTTFMETNFATYLSAFPYVTYDDATQAVATLMRRAEATPQAYSQVMAVAERFLTSPNSSMRDEEIYYLFLQAIDSSTYLDNARRARVRAQIADVLKNRAGTPAADFDIIDTHGNRTTLYKEAHPEQIRLIIFYDPDCNHCKEIIDQLRELPQLNDAIATGGLRVMAIYPDGDINLWKRAVEEIPAEWYNGYSPDGAITENELYTLPAMPVFYVLAPDNTVLLKDPSLPLLADWLAN